MKHRCDLGSVWVETNQSGLRISTVYGFNNAGSPYGHVVFEDGILLYWREVSGLSPIIKGCGSVYF
jgi:hypothetical protein